jgi:hypothetical protein
MNEALMSRKRLDSAHVQPDGHLVLYHEQITRVLWHPTRMRVAGRLWGEVQPPDISLALAAFSESGTDS